MNATIPAAGGYTSTAKILHWVLAAIVVGAITVGLTLDSLPDGPMKNTIYDLHKSTGILILVLMVARLAWRLTNPPPPSEPTLTRWQVGLSHANHWALYAILLTQPILGWVGSNAYGAPVPFYGLFELPRIVGEDKPFAENVLAVHGALGITAAALIVIHVSAALYHGLIRHDAVLARMTTEPARPRA